MGFFFRKSIGFGPFRVNLSRSGIGASFGVPGARVTRSARGKTYVTVGSHGFYYRQSIGGIPQNPVIDTRQSPTTEADPFAIPTASVEQLVDSSKEKLVSDLNEQARRRNPAILIYILAGIFVVVSLMLMGNSGVATPNYALPDVTNLSRDTGVDEYALLLAHYGQPNIVEVNQQPKLIWYIADYTSKQLGITFVPRGCVSAYQAFLQQASEAPSKDIVSRRKPHSPVQTQTSSSLTQCTPFTGFTIVAYKDLSSGNSLSAEEANTRLSQLQNHLQADPEVKLVASAAKPQGKSRSKLQPASVPIGAPAYDKQAFSDEQQRIQAHSVPDTRQQKLSVFTLGFCSDLVGCWNHTSLAFQQIARA